MSEPVLLMATVRGDDRVEAEPVLVALAGDTATLVLDDGEELNFDLGELRAALERAA